MQDKEAEMKQRKGFSMLWALFVIAACAGLMAAIAGCMGQSQMFAKLLDQKIEAIESGNPADAYTFVNGKLR